MEFEEWFDENRQELSDAFKEQEDTDEGLDWEDFLIYSYEDYLFEEQDDFTIP